MKRSPVRLIGVVIMSAAAIFIGAVLMYFIVNLAHRGLVFSGVAEGIAQGTNETNVVPMSKVLLGYGLTFVSAIGFIALMVSVPGYLNKGLNDGSFVPRCCRVLSYEALGFPFIILLFHLIYSRVPWLPIEWVVLVGAAAGAGVLWWLGHHLSSK